LTKQEAGWLETLWGTNGAQQDAYFISLI